MNYHKTGGHFLVDGQYGSTGKGLFAAWIAEKYGRTFDLVVSNAGPNSGHTFFHGDRKVVLKQLPTLAVKMGLLNRQVPVYLNSGAIINPEILNREVSEFGTKVYLSSRAVLISPEDKESEGSGTIAAAASTQQGGGAALSRKVLRDPSAVVGTYDNWENGITILEQEPDYRGANAFFEVSQGFSLGIHSHFYPKVTSRECTVAQALCDARYPAQMVRSVSMVVRTYPIRVGNLNGNSSGDCYRDQHETSWDAIGVEPELTTVTKRVRRVFTFSHVQFGDALYTNQPDVILVNFMNYLPKDVRPGFAQDIQDTVKSVLNRTATILYGFGPKTTDIYSDPRGPDAQPIDKTA